MGRGRGGGSRRAGGAWLGSRGRAPCERRVRSACVPHRSPLSWHLPRSAASTITPRGADQQVDLSILFSFLTPPFLASVSLPDGVARTAVHAHNCAFFVRQMCGSVDGWSFCPCWHGDSEWGLLRPHRRGTQSACLGGDGLGGERGGSRGVLLLPWRECYRGCATGQGDPQASWPRLRPRQILRRHSPFCLPPSPHFPRLPLRM